MIRKPFNTFRENIDRLEDLEDFGATVPFHKWFDRNLSKSAPCNCCGATVPPITCHCVSLTVVILSCPTDYPHYPGQAIAGCTVHVKNGGVDVTGSPFTTTNALTLKPQIYLSSNLGLEVSFTYPSGSPFTAPSSFSFSTTNCHSYRLEYQSITPSSGWFCDCCPSTCCDSNGDSIPIYGSLLGDDGIDSGWAFNRSDAVNYWDGSPPTNPSVDFRMTCGSSGQLDLTVTDSTDTVTGSATPTSCTPPFSVTFSLSLTGKPILSAIYGSTLTFTASSSQAFTGDWVVTDNGATAANLCLCPDCNGCEGLYPPLQLTDSTYGGPISLIGNIATNSSVQVTGAADCTHPGTLSTITTTLTYALGCHPATPNYLQVKVFYHWCCSQTALATASSICSSFISSSQFAIVPGTDCSTATFTFTISATPGVNPYNSGATITVAPAGPSPARFCRVCECKMADSLTALYARDSVYGGPVTMALSYSLGYWFANFTVSSVVYTYELKCDGTTGTGFYLVVHNNNSGLNCTSTNTINSMSDCSNPSFSFTMPSGGACGLYPSGGTVTINTT